MPRERSDVTELSCQEARQGHRRAHHKIKQQLSHSSETASAQVLVAQSAALAPRFDGMVSDHHYARHPRTRLSPRLTHLKTGVIHAPAQLELTPFGHRNEHPPQFRLSRKSAEPSSAVVRALH